MSSARWTLSHSSDPIRTDQAHDALKADSALWDRLSFAGFLEGVGAVYEQRICPACETALSVPADVSRILRVHAGVARIAAASLETLVGAQARSLLRLAPLAPATEHAAPVPHRVAVEETVGCGLTTAVALHSSAA